MLALALPLALVPLAWRGEARGELGIEMGWIIARIDCDCECEFEFVGVSVVVVVVLSDRPERVERCGVDGIESEPL